MKKVELSESIGSIREMGTEGLPVANVDWEGHQMATEGERIEDPGMGRPIIVRSFEFNYPPDIKVKPTKEQILTKDYIRHLEILLWTDEMELIQEPKVAFNKKGFHVFATCQAKKGSMIPRSHSDSLRPLQEKLNSSHTHK